MHFLARHPGLSGFSMAVDTPSHGQVWNLPDPFHCFNRSMTLLAAHTSVDVRSVVEATVRGEIVDPNPGDRLRSLVGVRLELVIQAQGIVELLQFIRDDELGRSPLLLRLLVLPKHLVARRCDQSMAIHAQAGSREASVLTLFRTKMAIKTRDLQFPGVKLVREGNGLNGFIVLLVARQVKPSQPGNQKHGATD